MLSNYEPRNDQTRLFLVGRCSLVSARLAFRFAPFALFGFTFSRSDVKGLTLSRAGAMWPGRQPTRSLKKFRICPTLQQMTVANLSQGDKDTLTFCGRQEQGLSTSRFGAGRLDLQPATLRKKTLTPSE